MPRVERTVLIRRPVPQVFAYMDDVSREPEWQPNLRAASQEPAGPVGVGTLKRYTSEFMGKELHNVYRVTDYEMYVRTVYTSTPESAVQATAEVTWEPVGNDTRVTMAVDATPGGALKLAPAALLERASVKELEEMLERLKACLEGE